MSQSVDCLMSSHPFTTKHNLHTHGDYKGHVDEKNTSIINMWC